MRGQIAVTFLGEGGFFVEVGPVLIAAAATFAAWLAARTANHRQQEQLTHDRTLHEARLKHDHERQREALSHDREVRDREDLRQVVDSAFESVLALSGAMGSLEVALENEIRESAAAVLADGEAGPAQHEKARADLAKNQEVILERQIEALKQMMKVQTFGVRLTLRLGEHEIVRAHYAYLDAAKSRRDVAEEMPLERPLTKVELERIQEKMEGTSEALVQLTNAIEQWLGVSLHQRRAEPPPEKEGS